MAFEAIVAEVDQLSWSRGRTSNKPRCKLSAKGRARIAAAQKERRARVKGQQNVVSIETQRNDVSVGTSEDRSSTAEKMGKSSG
jgi:hypothetical protein